MPRIPAACLAILLFVAIPGSQARQNPSQPVAPTAPGLDTQSAAVLASCKAAIGAATASQITDTVIQATMTNPGDPDATSATMTIKTKGANMVRWDSSLNGNSFSTISANGQQLHKTDRGLVPTPSSNAVHQRMLHLPALMIGQEIARGDLSAVYVAEETLNGRTVHRVKLARVSQLGGSIDAQLTKNSEIEVFIDTETNLIAKIAYLQITETDWRMGVPMEIFYDDYRPINGMMIPFTQRIVFNHSFTSVMQITSVQFNTGLADTIFQGVN